MKRHKQLFGVLAVLLAAIFAAAFASGYGENFSTNQRVLEVAYSYPDGGGYSRPGTTGVPEDVYLTASRF